MDEVVQDNLHSTFTSELEGPVGLKVNRFVYETDYLNGQAQFMHATCTVCAAAKAALAGLTCSRKAINVLKVGLLHKHSLENANEASYLIADVILDCF